MRRTLIIAVTVLIIATWLLTPGDAPPTVLHFNFAPGFDGVRTNVQVEGFVTLQTHLDILVENNKIRIDTTRPR